ncbi:MAG TPA: hypothetical protein VN516_07665, partial [Candidatus Baltobacteraceae bacterium]|nr:hypothetical protein [Candidatus Baltobacteraceae bacterium]
MKALIAVGDAPIPPIHLRDCPQGSIALADLKSSVGYWEGPPLGGGENHILYRGDADAFTEALTNFAAIKSTNLDLTLRD